MKVVLLHKLLAFLMHGFVVKDKALSMFRSKEKVLIPIEIGNQLLS